MSKIINIAGARPNFMKVAPVIRAMEAVEGLEPLLVHTGQHYDTNMSKLFFDELGLPEPDYNLEVGSGSHAVQTAEIMKRSETVFLDEKPDMVVVVGDVNSTIACALVAVKLGIPVAHVEAGLRSYDRTMPEEVNRLLTDSISELLFVTEESGVVNLKKEGIAEEKIHLVGNVMIDTLLRAKESAAKSKILDELSLEPRTFAVSTLHRPSNVDTIEKLENMLTILDEAQKSLPVVFPIHPRTRASIAEKGYQSRIDSMDKLILMDPIGYLDFLWLMSNARIVLTDSGGIQEETTVLGVPCLTLRENTERPITTTLGTNQLVGTNPDRIIQAFRDTLDRPVDGSVPPYWDGKAAERIAGVVRKFLG